MRRSRKFLLSLRARGGRTGMLHASRRAIGHCSRMSAPPVAAVSSGFMPDAGLGDQWYCLLATRREERAGGEERHNPANHFGIYRGALYTARR